MKSKKAPPSKKRVKENREAIREKNEVTESAYEVNNRVLVCSPEYGARNISTVLPGMLLRFVVLTVMVFSLVFFILNSFNINIAVQGIILYSSVFSVLFALTFGVRYFLLPGLLITASGIVYFFTVLPGVEALITLYNEMLQRLIDVEYYGFISKQIPLESSTYSKEGLLKLGTAILCMLTAAVFVPLLIRRSSFKRMIFPTVYTAAIITVISTYNISRSNWAFTFLAASICGILVMLAADRIYAFRNKKQTSDAQSILIDHDDRPGIPAEYLGVKSEKSCKASAGTAKEKRRARSSRNAKDKVQKSRLDPHEKMQRKAEDKKRRAKIKKERADRRRAFRCAVRRVKRYDDFVVYSRGAVGGFASFGALALTLIILLIPALKVKKYLSLDAVDRKLNVYREYMTAWLRGDDPILDLLDYANDRDNFTPHTTDAYPRYFKNTKLFEVNTQCDASVYLRGWIGVDFKDGSWYAADDETLSRYRREFGTDGDPKEEMFLGFFNMMAPEAVKYTDYIKWYNPNAKYGFNAMQVNLKREKTGSMYTHFASYYDPNIGLLNYGTNEKSDISYVNFFDGIYTGRRFKNAVDYATVSYVTSMRDQNWINNISALIAEYNINKDMIRAYRKDPNTEFSDWSALYSTWLFSQYRYSMTDEERAKIDKVFDHGDRYSNFVYDTYLDYEKSAIISELLNEILKVNIDINDIVDLPSEMSYDRKYAAQRESKDRNSYIMRNDIVMKIINWLKDNTEYTLTSSYTADKSLNGVENFLTVGRQGYCVQYASAVAVMLRECGIPARYVEGYIGTDLKYNRSYTNADFRYTGTILDSDLHAWVEVWYDGLGWIQYECTPVYYDSMYLKKGNGSSDIPITPPGDRDEIPYGVEQDELYSLGSEISDYRTRLDAVKEIFLGFKGLFGKEELKRIERLDGELRSFEKRYEALCDIMHDVLEGKIPKDDFDSNEFIKDIIYLGNEINIMDEMLINLESQALYYTELFDMIKKISLSVICSVASVTLIFLIFFFAKRASVKKLEAVREIIEKGVMPEKRRAVALKLIDSTEHLLKIYGGSPNRGEFRDEYAKRLAFDYETLFGLPMEYSDDKDFIARRNAEKGDDKDAKKRAKKLQKLAKARFKTIKMSKENENGMSNYEMSSLYLSLISSNICIGDILDSVAAEEFGGEMSEDEIKKLAEFYSMLYNASRVKLTPAEWLYRHCIKHQV